MKAVHKPYIEFYGIEFDRYIEACKLIKVLNDVTLNTTKPDSHVQFDNIYKELKASIAEYNIDFSGNIDKLSKPAAFNKICSLLLTA